MPWERVKVTGVTAFVGSVDGDDIDSGKIFIEEALDDSRNTRDQWKRGYASMGYSLGSAAAVRQLEDVQTFPIVMEAEFRRVTNGKTSRTIIAQVRPVSPAKAA